MGRGAFIKEEELARLGQMTGTAGDGGVGTSVDIAGVCSRLGRKTCYVAVAAVARGKATSWTLVWKVQISESSCNCTKLNEGEKKTGSEQVAGGGDKGCKMPWRLVVWCASVVKLVEDSMAGLSDSEDLALEGDAGGA
jgi:hypothetical protein